MCVKISKTEQEKRHILDTYCVPGMSRACSHCIFPPPSKGDTSVLLCCMRRSMLHEIKQMPSSHPPGSEWGSRDSNSGLAGTHLPIPQTPWATHVGVADPAPFSSQPSFPTGSLPDPSGMDPGFLHSQEGTDAPNQGLDLPRFQPEPAGICAKRKLCICRERWRRGSRTAGLTPLQEPPLPVYTFHCECVQRAVPSSAASSGLLADIWVLNKNGQSLGESITIRVLG